MSNNVWLHLGASAFFRAHQAYYFNLLSPKNWEMQLCNIHNSPTQKILKSLQDQNGEYHLEIISPDGEMTYTTINAIKKVILWDQGLHSIIEAGAQEHTKIISFTVTESGYFLTDDGRLDLSHPSIQNDLQKKGEINTLYGVVTQILLKRMQTHNQPITLLCCDNLRNNGDSFFQGLLDFINASEYTSLLDWIKTHTTAPNSMVDRITPKLDNTLFQRLEQQNIKDQTPLSCEKFTRWVVQDHFIAGRPALDQVGVEFVDNVTPFEETKIRILNASHSGLAWAGALLNKTYINETLQPNVVSIIKNYAQNDISIALKQHDIHVNTLKECEIVLNRFKNPYIKDTVARISSDSIAKLHGFIVPTLKDCLAKNIVPYDGLKLAGLYFLFLKKYFDNQLNFEYEDRALAHTNLKAIFLALDPIDAFTSHHDLFGNLIDYPAFKIELRKAILMLSQEF